MTEVEILQRLHPIFAQEGLEVELLGQRDQCLLVRARRTRPGTPVAFLMKALEGTLRRYHESLREVELAEYDPGEDLGPPPAPSPEFEKVLKHRAASGGALRLPPRPGLDLSGCDRAQAARALEQAHKLWSDQIARFWVKGCSQEPVKRALDKWQSFYQAAQSVHLQDDVAEVVLDAGPPAPPQEEPILWFPARLMLIGDQLP